jgi:phosphoribosylformylglycinamidine cyclo-ligase
MAKGMTYAGSGVSIDAGDALVERIAPIARATYGPRVLAGVGGFSGFFSLDYNSRLFRRNYRNPVLVASTDGVGTKLEVARLAGRHDTVGIDLVAMCVNDLAVCGAEPLFFLDYYATGRLDVEAATEVIRGIARGCELAGCALLGGETAEHPGTMEESRYDLAGFAVGVVERSRIIDGMRAVAGDTVLGIASSGLHSNGFSLVRKVVFEKLGLKVTDRVEELGMSVAEALLTPTRIYAAALQRALSNYRIKRVVKAIAHITGGGIVGNVPRVLPQHMSVEIRRSAWPIPPVFKWLQAAGDIEQAEMDRVFNQGLGMVMVVSPYYADAVMRGLEAAGETVYEVGRAVRTPGRSEVVFV